VMGRYVGRWARRGSDEKLFYVSHKLRTGNNRYSAIFLCKLFNWEKVLRYMWYWWIYRAIDILNGTRYINDEISNCVPKASLSRLPVTYTIYSYLF